jgi:hypothetical protein
MKILSLALCAALVLGFCALDASRSEAAFRACLEQHQSGTCHHALFR